MVGGGWGVGWFYLYYYIIWIYIIYYYTIILYKSLFNMMMMLLCFVCCRRWGGLRFRGISAKQAKKNTCFLGKMWGRETLGRPPRSVQGYSLLLANTHNWRSMLCHKFFASSGQYPYDELFFFEKTERAGRDGGALLHTTTTTTPPHNTLYLDIYLYLILILIYRYIAPIINIIYYAYPRIWY